MFDQKVLSDAKTRYEYIFNGPGKQFSGLAAGKPLIKPEWYDHKLIVHCRKLNRTYSCVFGQAAMYGLIYGLTFPESYIPLVSTGHSANIALLFDRYLSTALHVRSWYDSDMFDRSSKAYRSIKIVRGLHNQVSRQLEKHNNEENKQKSRSQELFNGVWLSQADMCATQAAFVGYIAAFPEHMGVQTWNDYDFEAFFHHWKCVGYCMGVTDQFNLCSGTVEQTKALCRTMYVENRSRLLNPVISNGYKMGEAVILAFGSKPVVLHRYASLNFFNSDPDMLPLRTYKERLHYALYDIFLHKLSFYPIILWLIARVLEIYFWLYCIKRTWIKRSLQAKYSDNDYRFEPLPVCPLKIKINYKFYTEHGISF